MSIKSFTHNGIFYKKEIGCDGGYLWSNERGLCWFNDRATRREIINGDYNDNHCMMKSSGERYTNLSDEN